MLASDGLLKITGVDAKKLLEGQLTCHVENLVPNQSCLGAHCNPQGRVISLFRLFLFHDAYYLFMPKTLVPIALEALKKYAVFYKVELKDASDELVSVVPITQLAAYSDVHQGIPAIYPETSGKFLPHDLNLPALGVVSFDKGCYTGQEIIARMQYRGKPKNHLYHATITTPNPPLPGEDIYTHPEADRAVGMVADVLQLENNVYHVLLVTDETNATNAHLYIKPNTEIFLTIIKNEMEKQ